MRLPERRKHPRFEGSIPVKFSGIDCDIVTETANISRTGAYCQSNKYIEPMTKLKVHLLIPYKKNNRCLTRKISCDGIVVRTESVPGKEYYNVAVYFSDIHARDAERITHYIKQSTASVAGENRRL